MKRVIQLDGVRGVAIAMVVIWHYFSCQISAGVSMWVSVPFSLTWSGVDLFFVLSGFLIAGIIFDRRESSNFLKVFYIRRGFRIFPLYFLLLGIYCILRQSGVTALPRFQWLFEHPLPLWSYALFVQNLFMALRRTFGPNWLGITWSLAIEEQFYLLLPFLVLILTRRRLLFALILFILLAPVLRYVRPGFGGYVLLPWRADSLLSGALLAFLVRSNPFMHSVAIRRGVLLVTFIVLLCGAGVMSVRPFQFGAFDHLWLAGLYASFILMAVLSDESKLGTVLRWRPLVWLGTHSYGIYMFHQAVSGLIYGLIRARQPKLIGWGDAGITLLALAVTLVTASLSFRFFEAPLLRYSHGVKYQTARASATTVLETERSDGYPGQR